MQVGALVRLMVVVGGLALAGFVIQLVLWAWALGKGGVATMSQVPPQEVPDRPDEAIAALERLGFEVAGAYRLVAPRAPDAHVVVLVHTRRPIVARAWATAARARPLAALVSPVGAGWLATAINRGSLHLPSALGQWMTFTTYDDLLACHERAMAAVAAHGVEMPILDRAGALELFEQEWELEAELVRSMSLSERLLVAWELGTGPATSQAVAEQPDLADRLAHPPFR